MGIIRNLVANGMWASSRISPAGYATANIGSVCASSGDVFEDTDEEDEEAGEEDGRELPDVADGDDQEEVDEDDDADSDEDDSDDDSETDSDKSSENGSNGGDVDGDGDMDLVTSNYATSTVSVLKNNGDGTYAAKSDYGTGSSPRALTNADVDGDGDEECLKCGKIKDENAEMAG
jgi:hypothetical protein